MYSYEETCITKTVTNFQVFMLITSNAE